MESIKQYGNRVFKAILYQPISLKDSQMSGWGGGDRKWKQTIIQENMNEFKP